MTEEPNKRSKVPIAWPVAWGIAGFLAFQYASGLWRLANRSGSMDSKFSQLAVQDYRLFLIGQNLLVLVAYAILAIAAWLLLMPMISTITRDRPKPRWLTALLSLIGCMLMHGYFMFRLVYSRPYFTGDASFGGWYEHVLGWAPAFLKPWLDAVIFSGLPILIVAGALFWWWKRGGTWMRWGLPLVIAGTAVWMFVSAASPAAPSIRKPDSRPMNVLIIGSDSLRGDRLGYSGYRPDRNVEGGVSPAIDAWAGGASIFDECRTPIGSTLEASVSMMTSTYPHTNGLRQMFASKQEIQSMEAQVEPVADLLEKNGYDTRALGDWCAGFYEVTPLGFREAEVSSFDSFRIYMSQAVFLAHFVVPLYFDNALGYELFPQIRSFAQFVTPEVVTERFESRLAEHATSEKPFFWHVFYSCNHLPYRTPEPYNRMFSDPDYRGVNANGVDFDIDGFIGGTDLEDKWAALPKKEALQIRALYDGCTRQFDDCFKRILEGLEKQGMAENTIVILTADHGDDLYETGVTLGHGLGFNGGDMSYHVPLVIHVPGVEPKRFSGQVRIIDIAPTIADLLGVEKPDTWEGQSLAGAIMGEEALPDLAYYGETQFPFIQFKVDGVERRKFPPMDGLTWIDPDFNHQFVLRDEFREPLVEAKQRCLRLKNWKLVCTPAVDGSRHFGLFHTLDDPDCRKDLSESFPMVAGPMKQALEAWIDRGEESSPKEIFPDGEPSVGG